MVDAREALRRDADDGEFHAAQGDALVDDRRVSRKLLRPLVVVEHDDWIAPCDVVFVAAQRTTERRTHVHRIEEVAADRHPDLPLRRLVGAIGEAGDDEGIGNGIVEAPGPVAQVDVVGIRKAAIAEAGIARLAEYGDHFAGAGHRQRPEDQPVGDAEHRGVGADANRDRQDGDGREARVLHQHPEAVLEVSNHC